MAPFPETEAAAAAAVSAVVSEAACPPVCLFFFLAWKAAASELCVARLKTATDWLIFLLDPQQSSLLRLQTRGRILYHDWLFVYRQSLPIGRNGARNTTVTYMIQKFGCKPSLKQYILSRVYQFYLINNPITAICKE